jgi:hypothetical protein
MSVSGGSSTAKSSGKTTGKPAVTTVAGGALPAKVNQPAIGGNAANRTGGSGGSSSQNSAKSEAKVTGNAQAIGNVADRRASTCCSDLTYLGGFGITQVPFLDKLGIEADIIAYYNSDGAYNVNLEFTLSVCACPTRMAGLLGGRRDGTLADQRGISIIGFDGFPIQAAGCIEIRLGCAGIGGQTNFTNDQGLMIPAIGSSNSNVTGMFAVDVVSVSDTFMYSDPTTNQMKLKCPFVCSDSFFGGAAMSDLKNDWQTLIDLANQY